MVEERENSPISISIEPYGHDGGVDIDLKKEIEVLETDSQVINRLKKQLSELK
jgi:chitinase